MPKMKGVCRVCGKEYEVCNTPNFTNTFRWQDVACSRKCGEEYLRRVLASRNKDKKKKD